jgi:hypothetical protein
VRSPNEAAAAGVLARLASLRQHQRHGKRSPHKPLLVPLALGRLAATGSSELPWTEAGAKLAELIAEFGPAGLDPRQVLGAGDFLPRTGASQVSAHATPHGGLPYCKPGTGSAHSAATTGRSPG